MDESEIRRALTEAQAAVVKAREAPAQRRRAVMLAREHGWSKYRIAAVLGVKGPTVNSIISSAEHEQERSSVLVTERNPHLPGGERAEGVLVVPVSRAAPVAGPHW